jgi:hypothetical protein
MTPIHKDVLPPTMSMKVTENHQLPFFSELNKKLFSVIYARMKDFRRRLPPPVQVASSQRTSVVPVDHTIRIQHGNDLEYELLS